MELVMKKRPSPGSRTKITDVSAGDRITSWKIGAKNSANEWTVITDKLYESREGDVVIRIRDVNGVERFMKASEVGLTPDSRTAKWTHFAFSRAW